MTRRSRESVRRNRSLLLKRARENEAELPGVAPYLAALERANNQEVSLRIRRDRLTGAARLATRQLNEACDAGLEAASALQSFIKSVLGFRNEKLLAYGIKPIRSRRPARKRPVHKAPVGRRQPAAGRVS